MSHMKGLELAELYFNEVGLPMIETKFNEYKSRIAAGLVGDGSECFGFDDDISKDHDWGPSFCVWLTQQDYELFGTKLQEELNQLPKDFIGYPEREESTWGSGRTGVFQIGKFFKRFIGFDHVPANLLEWRIIPEVNLATATNGKVFNDPLGEFTAFQDQLKAFYPEDIRLKKMASRCMIMAQSGQYNYFRCISRREFVAAQCAETEFINTAISMVFLLNKQYRPFYKWMHRKLKDLPILGEITWKLCSDLVTAHETESGYMIFERKNNIIEEICQNIIDELKKQNLTHSDSTFLLDHGPEVQSKIQDKRIKDMNVWIE